jgi:uncharacterized protein (TIGR02145 family)
MKQKLSTLGFFLVATFLIISDTSCDRSQYLRDPQGNKYKTVKVGDQQWMAENLRYDSGDGFFCYDNDFTQCKEMGGLYTWTAAANAAGKIERWHLPSKQEWLELILYYGGDGSEEDNVAYANMMADERGFDPQWSGVRISTGIYKAKELKGVNYWSSTTSEMDSTLAYSVGILSKFEIVSPHHYPKLNACSVRLVKDK